MRIKFILSVFFVLFIFSSCDDDKKTIRIAAIQMKADFGDVDNNLKKAETLVREAFDDGADWVILPEFFTSAMGVHSKMLDVACPINGRPMQLLKSLAQEYKGVVGGSFIAIRGEDSYNTFVLAFPDGNTFLHDKDYPSFWENYYYIGGKDDGVLDTPVGPVGAAVCWEFIRSGTARRMLGRVEIVVGGSCWWTYPDKDTSSATDKFRQANLSLLQETPVRFARMLGVPVVHASHAGTFKGYSMPDETEPFNSHYLGETQIVDGHGKILARMSYEDGEGLIVADVTLGEVEGLHEPIPSGFWIPELRGETVKHWEEYQVQGRKYYQDVTLPRRVEMSRSEDLQN